ncbi:MAG: NADH-quinone oxidoreductase subunit K [Halieaceae bacterium]|jgi:multicomponent Na+:H+ antiporter subunit C|nr:NADH-quinone oxidoreductase subunit K [Halieaceae bacterium]
MNAVFLYALAGVGLVGLALHALIVHASLLRKILAFNFMGSGVFLTMVALARRAGGEHPDAVPQAMVITGIVVAVAATALALNLMLELGATTRDDVLPDDDRA